MRRRQHNSSEKDTKPSGSPDEGEPLFLTVGFLRRPHGVQGEMVMEAQTDFPERLQLGKTLWVGENHEPMCIKTLRSHDKLMLVRFEGITTREEAARLRNTQVYVPADTLPPLPEGEYYFHQLLGLTIVDEQGVVLGKLAQILETGANDVYLVRAEDGTEALLPAIEEVILKIDLDQQQILVRPQIW
ncbi:MAG: ribosome maturation factor RimM [Anaerolineaceae bacterium]|nr:ribosome maturation factor RimM [Anaerolineaceae bacterium]